MATTLMIGSGAVHNAWGPVCQALEDVHGDFPSATANTLFASVVYKLRWYHAVTPSGEAEQRDKLLSEYRQLTERIAFRLREATESGAIYMREPLDGILREFLVPPWCVITTNWDLTLLDGLKRTVIDPPHPTFLHGSCEAGKPLYLPSETIEEPYRTDEEKRHLGALHVRAIQDSQRCDRLLVYGLSFDPLDAELGVVLFESIALANNLREVIVFDLNPAPVVERLRALLASMKPQPRFEGRGIVPKMRSNYRILKGHSGFRVGHVFYDRDGRPDSSLQPAISSIRNVRELKRTLRAVAKAAGRSVLPEQRVVLRPPTTGAPRTR